MHRNSKNQTQRQTVRGSNRTQQQQPQQQNINQQMPNRANNFDGLFNDFNDNDDFSSDYGFMRRMDDFGNMRSLMNFDSFATNNNNININLISSNLPGTSISKSYVSTVKYDANGTPHKEEYHSQSIKQTDQTGKKIQETQKAYQNTSTGVQKSAQERILNEKGHKFVKECNLNSGDSVEQHIYKGMGEEELPQFNNEYFDYRNKSNFERNYQMLESSGANRGLNRINNNRNVTDNLMLGQEQVNPNLNNRNFNGSNLNRNNFFGSANNNSNANNLGNVNDNNNNNSRNTKDAGKHRNFWKLQK